MSLLSRDFLVHNLSCQGSHVHVCEANYCPYILVLLWIFALANSLNVNLQDIYFISFHCISSYFGKIHNAKHEIRLIFNNILFMWDPCSLIISMVNEYCYYIHETIYYEMPLYPTKDTDRWDLILLTCCHCDFDDEPKHCLLS